MWVWHGLTRWRRIIYSQTWRLIHNIIGKLTEDLNPPTVCGMDGALCTLFFKYIPPCASEFKDHTFHAKMLYVLCKLHLCKYLPDCTVWGFCRWRALSASSSVVQSLPALHFRGFPAKRASQLGTVCAPLSCATVAHGKHTRVPLEGSPDILTSSLMCANNNAAFARSCLAVFEEI